MKIIEARQRVKRILARLYTWCIKDEFYSFGKSKIYPSVKITGAKSINIGNNVVIQDNSWLYALPSVNDNQPVIIISDNVYLGHQLHLTSVRKVVIEKDALIADKVYISDNIHNYADISKPIKDQGIFFKGEVIIGKNCWIGENACVIGASVGENAVISANAVVTKNIPAYCVAAGVPARIIKKFDFKSNTWRNTDFSGNFVNE